MNERALITISSPFGCFPYMCCASMRVCMCVRVCVRAAMCRTATAPTRPRARSTIRRGR